LGGAQGIDRAAIVEEQAAAVRIFADAEAVLERIKVAFGKFSDGQMKVPGQGCGLVPGDIDGSGLAHTALAALAAFETNPGVKEIGTPDKRV